MQQITPPTPTPEATAQLAEERAQRQRLETLLAAQQEKVDDLKYHNSELKRLNQKQAELHQRELEMTRKEVLSSSTVLALE